MSHSGTTRNTKRVSLCATDEKWTNVTMASASSGQHRRDDTSSPSAPTMARRPTGSPASRRTSRGLRPEPGGEIQPHDVPDAVHDGTEPDSPGVGVERAAEDDDKECRPGGIEAPGAPAPERDTPDRRKRRRQVKTQTNDRPSKAPQASIVRRRGLANTSASAANAGYAAIASAVDRWP